MSDLQDRVLVIVESPTKANTIKKFLPKNFMVESSFGHIRDLPQSAADIPAALKKTDWAKLGVNVAQQFEPLYIIPKDKAKKVRELKDKLKLAQQLYLATDEDREGESISWHLLELLKPKVPVKRMVFHEITKSAIQQALKDTRDLDLSLVRAQETRRILDRLFGYTLSPLLWKKIAYGLSAGRVQSCGLRMIVERERERIKFVKSSYGSLRVKVKKLPGAEFESKLQVYQGKRLALGKDFDETTGLLKDASKVLILEQDQAKALAETLMTPGQTLKVEGIEERDVFSKPLAPFITSTLQQEANRKLGLSAKETMRTAQKLYEEGLITYMRTDSPSLSKEATQAARQLVQDLFGDQYLTKEVMQYASRSAAAQEAHEAIRPAGHQFVHPEQVIIGGRERALYELIWKRTVASQMVPAHKKSMTVTLRDEGGREYAAQGLRVVFAGYLRAYVEGQDDPEAALEEQDVLLPALTVGEALPVQSAQPGLHETRPAARYSEASLIQRLEKEGVGRPSTYASIISTILDRGYVRKEGNTLVPTLTAMAVIHLLETYFPQVMAYSFTSQMEQTLDVIASGKGDYLAYLNQFYLGPLGLDEQVKEKEKKIAPDEVRTIELAQLKESNLSVKIGRYGPYVIAKGEGKKASQEDQHVSIPEDRGPADLSLTLLQSYLEVASKGPSPLGIDPASQKPVYCLTGRFGAYVQLGDLPPAPAVEVEAEEPTKAKGKGKKKVAKISDAPKPKRASIPAHIDPKQITLEQALELLRLPREVGLHPETEKMILANVGRFGPYLSHNGEFRSIPKTDDVYTVDLDRAVEIVNAPKVASRGATLLRVLGEGKKSGKKISLYNGKYGAFLKVGVTNVGIPAEMKEPALLEKITLEQAEEIIDKSSKKR